MNVKTAKKSPPRVDVNYLTRFNLQTYGADNLYPQHLQDITGASGTTELCLNRYSKFIEGYGFDNEAFASYKVNRQGTTGDELLHDVAEDVARFGGFALHVNYNVLCQVTEVSFVPFENCRLEESDAVGNVAHIVIHPDWKGKKTRAGKRLTVDDKHISRINVFNPDPAVVTQEILNAGGIEHYNGQILWCSKDGVGVYPTPIYDACIVDISTDEGLGNIKNRNVRNNFLVACMLISKKGVPKVGEDGEYADDEQMISDEDLLAFQGDENSSKIMNVTLENDEDVPQVIPFPTKNIDKEFSTTDASVIERIYAQFHQELFYSIRIGKLGFSGDVMRDAFEYYAGEVTNEQRFIERGFERLFRHWVDPLLANANFSIQPTKYISAEDNK
jgi:hypothetical protein